MPRLLAYEGRTSCRRVTAPLVHPGRGDDPVSRMAQGHLSADTARLEVGTNRPDGAARDPRNVADRGRRIMLDEWRS